MFSPSPKPGPAGVEAGRELWGPALCLWVFAMAALPRSLLAVPGVHSWMAQIPSNLSLHSAVCRQTGKSVLICCGSMEEQRGWHCLIPGPAGSGKGRLWGKLLLDVLQGALNLHCPLNFLSEMLVLVGKMPGHGKIAKFFPWSWRCAPHSSLLPTLGYLTAASWSSSRIPGYPMTLMY